jgi:hypothetical protein
VTQPTWAKLMARDSIFFDQNATACLSRRSNHPVSTMSTICSAARVDLKADPMP